MSGMRRKHKDLADVKPAIHQHRRLYADDLPLLASSLPELIAGLVHNRLVVAMPEDAIAMLNLSEWLVQYEAWLDENLSGFYRIDVHGDGNRFILSFESNADMMQFALTFR
jgi:hypothetical protein